MTKRIHFTILFLALGACAHSIHQVHTSDFIPMASIESGKMVKGSGSQSVILGFVGDTHYIDQAYQQIQSACPGGMVTGITAQLSTDLGFFSWTNRALMQGLCITR